MFQETADIDTASDDYASRFSGAAGKYFLDVQNAIVANLLNDIDCRTALDIGGGHAQLAPLLVGAGLKLTVTGSDESCRNRLDQCLKPEEFVYKTCDSLKLPFDDNSFDVVLSFRLLPHAKNWEGIVAEMCRVAKICVLFDYPDMRSSNLFYEYLFSFKKNIEKNTRTYTLFTRSQIREVLDNNGYSQSFFRPQFLIPMVIHRKISNQRVSAAVELLFKMVGLTKLFGSPIIVRSDKAA